MFCTAFLVRTYVSAPLVRFLEPRLIGNRLHGYARGIAMTVLNVGVSSPVTGAIVAFLFAETDDFLDTYFTALAVTMPMSVFASYFIVGPIAKLIFNNVISPASGLKAFGQLERHAMSILRLFGM